MKTSILAAFTAFALGITLASGATAAICDKHEQDRKAKRGKTAAHVKAKRGKSKAANVANASRKLPQSSQFPASVEEHHDHSAHNHHSAHDEHSETPSTTGGEHHDSPGKIEQSVVKMNIPDLEVVDQDNRRVKFYSDLVKGKTVAINFIFTTCTTICTPLGATFARVQKELKAASNDDVQLISISVDPVTDTPQRLKTWRAKFKAGDGWTLVTGDKQTINKLLEGLSASAAKRDDHSAIVLIGNDLTGQWTRAYGLAKPSQIITLIKEAQGAGSAAQILNKGGNR